MVRIKQLRESKGLNMKEAARLLALPYTTYVNYEKGQREPTSEVLIQLADFFETTVDYLVGRSDAHSQVTCPTSDVTTDILNHPQFLPTPKMKKWRVIGSAACGEPMHRELEEFAFAPDNINADVVFRCEGDSMIGAHILDGDIAFVRACEVEDGQIAVVRVEDDYSLKRIYRGPDYLELRSENPKYPPIIIRGEQTNAEIIGRVVFFLTRPL